MSRGHKAKKPAKDDDDAGPRINNDITAPFLRLVSDQGRVGGQTLSHTPPFTGQTLNISVSQGIILSPGMKLFSKPLGWAWTWLRYTTPYCIFEVSKC